MARSSKKVCISSGELNRYGYWIDPNGFSNKAEFEANPTLLYNHNYSKCIGRVEDIHLENGKLFCYLNFDSDDEFAKDIEGQWERDFLNATSIGYDPIEVSNDSKYLKEGQTRSTVLTWGLNEVSVAVVPVDAGATKLSADNELNIDTVIPKLNSLKLDTQEMDKDFSLALTQLGLPTTATPAEALQAIQKLQNSLSVASTSRVDNLLAIGKAKGIVNDSNEASFRQLGLENYDAVQNVIGPAPEKPAEEKPAEEKLSVKSLFEHIKKTSSEKLDEKGKSFNELSKTNSDALYELKLSNPKLYNTMASDPEGKYDIAPKD